MWVRRVSGFFFFTQKCTKYVMCQESMLGSRCSIQHLWVVGPHECTWCYRLVGGKYLEVPDESNFQSMHFFQTSKHIDIILTPRENSLLHHFVGPLAYSTQIMTCTEPRPVCSPPHLLNDPVRGKGVLVLSPWWNEAFWWFSMTELTAGQQQLADFYSENYTLLTKISIQFRMKHH